MSCLKKYILIICFGLLIFPVIYCSNIFGPESNNKSSNPVVIEFNSDIDLSVGETFNNFIAEYNIDLDEEKLNFRFDIITSYITNATFEKNKPRFYNDTLVLEQKEILIRHLLNFVDKWQELFGIFSDNIKLFRFEYCEQFNGYRIIFIQDKINNKVIKSTILHELGFLIKLDCTIYGFWSSGCFIENDRGINNYNIHKIMNNLIGYNISGYGDNFKISKGDFFKILNDFEYYIEKKSESYYIYKLKSIVVKSPDSDNKYTLYCHPATGEIIHVKRDS